MFILVHIIGMYNRQNAQQHCQDRNGSLAEIRNDAKYAEFQNIAMHVGMVWLRGAYNRTDATYRWDSDGSVIDMYWAPGEPISEDGFRNCVVMTSFGIKARRLYHSAGVATICDFE